MPQEVGAYVAPSGESHRPMPNRQIELDRANRCSGYTAFCSKLTL